MPELATPCHDCGVPPGQLHTPGCDIERCPSCGGQAISCDCPPSDLPRIAWSGEFPGVAECREWGWYGVILPSGQWARCTADTPGATENLNRLRTEARWDRDLQRFVLPT